jgi:transcriptional activator SPT8
MTDAHLSMIPESLEGTDDFNSSTIWKGDPDPSTPPWAVSSCWSSDGQYIYVGRRNGSVDEYDFKNRSLVRNLKMPIGSGSVTAVAALKDSRQLLIASYDNIRYRPD